jgi:hypothetical protein
VDVTVTDMPQNVPPQLSFSSPPAGSVFTQGELVSVSIPV